MPHCPHQFQHSYMVMLSGRPSTCTSITHGIAGSANAVVPIKAHHHYKGYLIVSDLCIWHRCRRLRVEGRDGGMVVGEGEQGGGP